MDKINFVNKGQPAINDTNMNLLQTNVGNAINEKVSTTDIVNTLDSTAIDKPLSANMGKELNNKLNTEFIVATTTVSSNLSSNFKILLNSTANSSGNTITLDTTNNKILIGKGISNIEVSANIFADNPNRSGYIWGNIRKNRITVSSTIIPYANQGGYISCPIPQQIIRATEGDYIELIADSTCGGTIRTGNTTIWLQVKKIN